MQELLGAPVAKQITAQLAESVETLKANGVIPKLAIVRLGENAGDLAYERGALNRMAKVGVEVEVHALDTNTSQDELNKLLDELSLDNSVDGVLLMRPLPVPLSEAEAAAHLCSRKDIDGMTQGSFAKVYSGSGQGWPPCTAEAVIAILDHYGFDVAGKHVVVLGRSLVVGKPLSQLLLAKNATVTVCHSKTANLKQLTAQADILVSCMGRAHMIDASYLGENAVVVDVSTNDDGNGGITGDVDSEAVLECVAALTPVPRGVGSVTTSILASHVVQSAAQRGIL